MKSLKAWSKLQEANEFEKQVKKIESSVGGGVSAAGVFESWVFIVARLSGSTTRPTPKDVDKALGDTEFHNKGASWFNKVGWSSRKDGKTGEGYQVEWIIDAIEMVGADVKTIKEINQLRNDNKTINHSLNEFKELSIRAEDELVEAKKLISKLFLK